MVDLFLSTFKEGLENKVIREILSVMCFINVIHFEYSDYTFTS